MPERMSEDMPEDMPQRLARKMNRWKISATSCCKWKSSTWRCLVCNDSALCQVARKPQQEKWLNLRGMQQSVESVSEAMSALVTADVVGGRLPTIYVGTKSRFAKGVEHVWRYQLMWVGRQQLFVCLEPPSTTHANDIMFIVPQMDNGALFHVVYEGRRTQHVPKRLGEPPALNRILGT